MYTDPVGHYSDEHNNNNNQKQPTTTKTTTNNKNSSKLPVRYVRTLQYSYFVVPVLYFSTLHGTLMNDLGIDRYFEKRAWFRHMQKMKMAVLKKSVGSFLFGYLLFSFLFYSCDLGT